MDRRQKNIRDLKLVATALSALGCAGFLAWETGHQALVINAAFLVVFGLPVLAVISGLFRWGFGGR